MNPATAADSSRWRADLAGALRTRLAVIADTGWRDRDAASHLEALREVSERIASLAAARPHGTDPKLVHYLDRCSFDKALAVLSQER